MRGLAVFLLVLFFSAGVCFSGDEQAVALYKTYREEIAACFDYEDYIGVNRRYGSQERLAKIDGPETRKLSDEEKENLFQSIRANIFDIDQLKIKDSEGTADTLVINYEKLYFPDTYGQAVLVKENGLWKVKSDSLFPE
jgi:hypothetical protein